MRDDMGTGGRRRQRVRRAVASLVAALVAGGVAPATARAADPAAALATFTATPSSVTVDGAEGTALEDLRTLLLPASQGGGATTIDSAALARIALARIDLESSALARIALARIALARIDVGHPALADVSLAQIPLSNDDWDSWEAFLVGTSYEGAPLQTVSLLQILQSTDPVVVERRADLDLGSLDIAGTLLASLPVASLLLAGAPLGDVPVDVVGGVPVTGEQAWCDALGDVLADRGLTCEDLGLDGTSGAGDGTLMSAALAGIPLESVALARIPLEALPESGLEDATSPLAAIGLAQTDIQSTALARIALARISTDPQASALARIALARIDLEASALARIALARIDLQSSALARIALARIDLQSSALARIALARIDTSDGSALDGVDLATLPVAGTALAGIPLARANLVGTPLGATPLATIGIAGTPLADIPLTRIGPNASLRALPLSAFDLAPLGLTLGDVPAFGACGADPLLPCSTPLTQLDLTNRTLGDLIEAAGAALGTSTLGSITPATFDDGQLTGTLDALLGALLYDADEEPLTGTLADLDLATGDLVGSLADLLRTLPAATLAAAGLDTLGGILALVPGLDATLGELILELSSDDLDDATLGELLPHLDDPLEGSVADLMSSVSDVSELDLGTLGELLALVIGGPITDLGTLADLLRDLNGDTGLTLADLILFLLSPSELDWEALTLDADDLAAIRLAAARVRYEATIDVTCGDTACPAGHVLEVVLPDGFAFAGEVEGAGEPEVDGQTLRFALPDVTSTGPVTIAFDVLPVIGEDAVASAQLLDPAGAPAGDPLTAEVDVASGPDAAPGTEGAPRALEPERLYLAALSSSDDVHYWEVQITSPGQRLSVFLGNLVEDYDLVVYGPEGSTPPLRGDPDARTLPLDTNPLSLDPLGDVAGTEPREDLPLLDRPPHAIAAERQGSGASERETVETGPLEVGRYLIQVSGYNGAFSGVPYTIRAAITEPPALGSCDPRSWTNPPDDFDAAVTSVDADDTAVFLVNRQRLAATFGAAGADLVLDKLAELIAEEPGGLQAGVLALDSIDAVNDAYAAWDDAANRCEPQAANDVVRAIGAAIDGLDAPALEHLVVVGADDIIPFSRVRDATTLANEQDYAQAFAGNNELASALARGYLLTDDPLADAQPTASADREVFVPELGVGRLVEEPGDIAGALVDFVQRDGELPASSAFSSGYEFLTDGARAVADALEDPDVDGLPDRSLQDELVGDGAAGSTWTDEHLRRLVFEADEPADLLSLNAHFDHSRLLPGLGNAEGAEDELVTIEDVAANVAGSLLFSMGCHSGLSVPTSSGGGDEEDWAETFVRNGALWVGNTGFGYGDTDVVALSEQLMTLFAQHLDGAVPVGTALARAKQQYLADLGVLSPYDEKALMQTTLFGLPMYELADPAPLPPADHTPPTLVDVPGAPGLQQAEVDAHDIELTPSSEVDDEPRYWSVGGKIQATQYRPIQPRMTIDVTPSEAGQVARGALVTDLVSEDVLTRPRVFRPVVHNAGQERVPVIGDSAFPAAVQSVSSYEGRDGARQQLVLIPGQFRTSSEGLVDFGTQRLYPSVDTVVYFGEAGALPAPPATIEFADGAHVGNTAAFVVETDRPASDILRVYVLYTAEGMRTADGLAAWEGLDLELEDGRWTGNEALPAGVAADAGLDYIVQVVTTDGQVSITSNKGRFFEAVTPRQTGDIRFVVDSPSSGGWYRAKPVPVSLEPTRPMAGPLEVSVDGGPYQPYGGPFPVTGEGLHRLRARSVGDPTSDSSLVLPIDTRAPNVGPRDPVVTPPPTDGWNKDEPTVTFFREGDQGSISSGADRISYTATGAQPTTDTQTAHDSEISADVAVEGVTTFSYWSTDRAGNDNDTKTFDVRYDAAPPVIDAPDMTGGASPSTWQRSAPTTTVAVADPLPAGSPAPWAQSSRLRLVTFELTGATTSAPVNLIDADDGFPQSMVVTIDPDEVGLREGVTGVTVRAVDVAGNEQTRTFEIWFDETAPTITFSPPGFATNLVATTSYGGSTKPRTVFAPTATFAKEYPTQGGKIPTYLLNSTVVVPYRCDDPLPPAPPTPQRSSGIARCSGGVTAPFAAGAQAATGELRLSRTASASAFNTSSVGVKTIVVQTEDVAGNPYFEVFTYRVVYKIEMLYDHTKTGKSGTTIPIKLKLRDANGVDVSSAGITLTALEYRAGGQDATFPGNANPGGVLQYDARAKAYQFNAKPNLARGTYGLAFQASLDPGPTNAAGRFIGPWTPYRAEFRIG